MKPHSRKKVVHQARKVFSKSQSQSSSFFNASVTYKRQIGTLRHNNRELAQQLSSSQQKAKDLEGKNFILQKTINLQIPKIVHANLSKMVSHLQFYLAIVQQTMQFCQNPNADIDVDATILNPDIDLSIMTPLNATVPAPSESEPATPSSVRPRAKPDAPMHIYSMTPIAEQDTIYERGSLSADEPDRRSRKSSVLSNVNVTRRTKSKSRSCGPRESEKTSPAPLINNESEDEECSIIGEKLVDCSVSLDRLPTFIRPISTPRVTLLERKEQGSVQTIPKTFPVPVALRFDENHDDDATIKIPVDMDLTIMSSENSAAIVISNEKPAADTNLATGKLGKKLDPKTSTLKSVEVAKESRKSEMEGQDGIFSANGDVEVLPVKEGKTRQSVSNYRKSISSVSVIKPFSPVFGSTNGCLPVEQKDIASPNLKRRVTFRMDAPPPPVNGLQEKTGENESTDTNSSSEEDSIEDEESTDIESGDKYLRKPGKTLVQKTRTSPRKLNVNLKELHDTLVQGMRTSPRKLNVSPQDPDVVGVDRKTYDNYPSSDVSTESESIESDSSTDSQTVQYLTTRTSPNKVGTNSPQRENLSRRKSAQNKVLVDSQLVLPLSSSSDDSNEPQSKAANQVDAVSSSTKQEKKNAEITKPSSPVKKIPPSPSLPRSPISQTVAASPKASPARLLLSPSSSNLTDNVLSVPSGSGVLSRKRIRQKYRRSSDSSFETSCEESSDSDFTEKKKVQGKTVNRAYFSSTRGQKTNEKNRYLIKKSKPGPKSSKKAFQDENTLPKTTVPDKNNPSTPSKTARPGPKSSKKGSQDENALSQTTVPNKNEPSTPSKTVRLGPKSSKKGSRDENALAKTTVPDKNNPSTTSKTVKEKQLKTFANLNNSSSEDSDDKSLVYKDNKQMGKTATNHDKGATVSKNSVAHDRPTAETDELQPKLRKKLIGKSTLTQENLQSLMNSSSDDSDDETAHDKPTAKTDKLPSKYGKIVIGKSGHSRKKMRLIDSTSNEDSDDTSSTVSLVPKKEIVTPKPNAKKAVKKNKLNSTPKKKLTGRKYVSKKKANLNNGTESTDIRKEEGTTSNPDKTGNVSAKTKKKGVVEKSVTKTKSSKKAINNIRNAKNQKSSEELDDDDPPTNASKTNNPTQKRSADYANVRDTDCVRNMAKTVAVVELPTLEAEQKRLSRVPKMEPITPAQGSRNSTSEKEPNSKQSLEARRKTSLLEADQVKKERLSKANDDTDRVVAPGPTVGARRARTQVSYLEPSLGKKMRRPD